MLLTAVHFSFNQALHVNAENPHWALTNGEAKRRADTKKAQRTIIVCVRFSKERSGANE